MAPKTRCLASYIEDVHYRDNFLPWGSRIFDYGITHYLPTLRPDHMNRILLFPGSFNPPHLGHLELLRHGFEGSRDMNVTAAIILPLDNESLVRKFRREGNAQIFTKAERARLWNGYGLSDWYWTYDRSVSEWFAFQEHLTEVIERDGFDIKWVLLCGPDYVNVGEVPLIPLWRCKDIIISNVGRPADFTTGALNRLTTLKGCEDWEGVVPDLDTLRRYAREDTSRLYSGMFMLSPIYAQHMLTKILIALSERLIAYSTRLLKKLKPLKYAAEETP